MAWFFCPTQIFMEQNALKNNAAVLSGLGRRCLVVTGKRSAAASGVLGDLAEVLPPLGIEYEIFDKIEPNPSIHTCREGGRRARALGADFILGVGGGSPLDAAKAVAAFAANDAAFEAAGDDDTALFDPLPNAPLPVAAIPTTAGTGSEANLFSVLTLPETGVKRTFKTPASYPVVAFVDPRYTLSLPYDQTVSTALDAFCHCAESYYSPKATALTRALCAEGAGRLWRGLLAAEGDDLGLANRESLMLGSTLGGICIGQTGTGFPHPMGYNLTLSHGVPHGAACAVFEGEFLRQQMMAAPELDFLGAAGLPDEALDKIPAMAGVIPRLTDAQIERYVALVLDAANFANSVAPLTDPAAIAAVYRKLLGA